MKTSAFLFRAALIISAVVPLSGCMNFEYTGREFAPLAGGQLPEYFGKRADLPPGVYSIIGRAKITTSASRDREEIRLRLLDEAAARGADAVCLVSVSKIEVGLYESDGHFSGPDNPDMNRYNLTPDGAPIQKDMAGKSVSLPDESRKAVKLVVRALFLKNKKELEKIISDREKQLDKIIEKPSALPGGEN